MIFSFLSGEYVGRKYPLEVAVLKFIASVLQHVGFKINKNLFSYFPHVGLIFFTDSFFAKGVNLVLKQVLISSDRQALDFRGVKWCL